MTIPADDRPWLSQYPEGVPADLPPFVHGSVVDLLDESFRRFASLPAYSFMGAEMSYAAWDTASRRMAAYLQSLDLRPGDRVAVMLPNMPQYFIAMAAILRAGMVLVNVNPQLTARELEYQLVDSGAKAIFIVENCARVLQQCRARTLIEHVVLTSFGDCLLLLKGWMVNLLLRHVKKAVPSFVLQGAVRFNTALKMHRATDFRPVSLGLEDVALLQYTGGTTGKPKGAVLLHRNILANTLQTELWILPIFRQRPIEGQIGFVCALPLYHIFAFTINLMLAVRLGGKNILVPDPRDLPAMFRTLAAQRFHVFPAVNTLFNSMLHHPGFGLVDWSQLRLSLGGGMAVQSVVADLWLQRTGCVILEGYGLSETSPVVTCNPVLVEAFTGTIGVPLPGTRVKLIDEDGQDVMALGESGEIAVKGPQVMARYWQYPGETGDFMTEDGYFKTGDIGVMDARGHFTILDRKKDMIVVSGFNVFPIEVEEVLASVPYVLECAVIGVPNEKSGESVKAFVVVKPGAEKSEELLLLYCRNRLARYKIPRSIEFRDELPKSAVGKILRRVLREQDARAQTYRALREAHQVWSWSDSEFMDSLFLESDDE